MKEKIVGIGICMLMMVAVVLPAAEAMNKRESLTAKPTMDFVPGEFLVKLAKDTTFLQAPLMALNEQHGVYSFQKVFPHAEGTILDNTYLLHVPTGSDIISIVQDYSSCPDVVYAEPNAIGSPCGIPNDANFSNQWHLNNVGQVFLQYNGANFSGKPDADIDAPEAWDIETGSPNIVIAIVDSGIDYTHPDLADNVWTNTKEIPGNGIDDDHNGYIDDVRGWDFAFNDSNITDGHGHGTMCAGVADAIGDNGLYGAGVCWHCKIMPVRVADASWGSTAYTCARGIVYAADNGANVISMSFAWDNLSTLKAAIDHAYSKGVFLCAAAGNSNSQKIWYPAGYNNVVACAATTQNDTRVTPQDWPHGWGSEYGDWVDIAAPGNIIFTTLPTYPCYFTEHSGFLENFDWGCGTSFSSPQVAGVAALLLSKAPSLTPAQIKTLLCKNVDPYYSSEYIGTGRLNAQKALTALVPNPPTITGPTKAKIKVATAYNFTTTTSDENNVSYYIDWGDGTNSSWLGPYPSGHVITQSHTWTTKGTYIIQVKAKDIMGFESDWSTLAISMPLSYEPPTHPFLTWLFQRFPNAFPILRHLLGY